MSARDTEWDSAVALHAESAAAFAQTAEAIAPEAFTAPVAPGKWSPAQIVDHLIRSYDGLLQELAGGAGPEVKTKPWQRAVLRWTLVPRILRGAGFPRGARAPREIRPAESPADRASLLAAFRERRDRFDAAIRRAREERPHAKLTHAYFGSYPLADALLMCARHIDHHRAQIPGDRLARDPGLSAVSGVQNR